MSAIVRGRDWFERLSSGRAQLFSEIAEAEGVTGCYVAHLVPLAFLARNIVASILAGIQPVELAAEVLTKRVDLPLAWAEQREPIYSQEKAASLPGDVDSYCPLEREQCLLHPCVCGHGFRDSWSPPPREEGALL